eukprot:3827163-Prymnesium_polylepis.1
MQKWLLKKKTSPVTGNPLANTTLVVNQNLKKLIRDSAATKREAPIDEDLFGSDGDDEPAHRHATATAGSSASVAALIATWPLATVDAASSSSAAAAPSRKRMKG